MMAIPSASYAQTTKPDDGLSPAYSKCMAKADGSTASLVACIDPELKAQDAELNKVYAAFIKTVEAVDRDGVKKAQRDWIAYRDSTCELITLPNKGGTLAIVTRLDCHLTETARRVQFFKALQS